MAEGRQHTLVYRDSVMAKKKKTSPKKPDDGTVRHLSPDVLDFDFKNPRLSQSDIGDVVDEADI